MTKPTFSCLYENADPGDSRAPCLEIPGCVYFAFVAPLAGLAPGVLPPLTWNLGVLGKHFLAPSRRRLSLIDPRRLWDLGKGARAAGPGFGKWGAKETLAVAESAGRSAAKISIFHGRCLWKPAASPDPYYDFVTTESLQECLPTLLLAGAGLGKGERRERAENPLL